MSRFFLFINVCLLFSVSTQSQTVDGDPTDWPESSLVSEDPSGDGQSSGPDFRRMSISNDALNLLLKIKFENPINFRSEDLRLMIDADNDINTGTKTGGRGIDFSWDFDRNRGIGSLNYRSDIGRGNLIHAIAPNGSTDFLEISVSLEAFPAVVKGEPIHLFLYDEGSFDFIPDQGTSISYLPSGPLGVQPAVISPKKKRGDLRIVSWNMLRDAPFKNNNLPRFERVLAALEPDIIMLQELYDAQAQDIQTLLTFLLQMPSGQDWEVRKNHDCITASRYPIRVSTGSDGNLITVHETEDVIGSDIIIVNAHLPCCTSGESGRISESDNILRQLEILFAGNDLKENTTLVIGGDLNSGGDAPELIQLTQGVFASSSRSPLPQVSTPFPLIMGSPRHLETYDQFTWGSDGTSSFGSSKLDFLLFDPERVLRTKAFTLDTDFLLSETLEDLNLLRSDSWLSDHLTLVLDMRSRELLESLEALPMEANGDTTSTWWGDLNAFHYPFIRHHELGWTKILKSGDGIWFFDQSRDWTWTSGSIYPWTFNAQTSTWTYVFPPSE